MENRRNYYRILHVQRDAPVEIIKTSYRTMMQRLRMHPDLGGDHWTATVINEAYATLSQPDKRAAYDRELRAPAEQAAGKSDGSQTNQQQTAAGFEDMGHAPAGQCIFCATPHQLHTIEPDSDCRRCESPLSPSTFEQHDESTRRAVMRMPKSFPLVFMKDWGTNQLLQGCALDLSTNGLRFVSDAFVAANSLISIDSDICNAVARVRSCNKAGPLAQGEYEIGVHFETLRFKKTQGGFVSVTA